MSLSWTNTDILVGHLRVRGGGDPLTTRLRVTGLLDAADLQPAGLPPAAIVCIRTLRDARPGLLPVQQPGLRPPAAWEQAMRDRLTALAREAARPLLGPVPAAAQAVLFIDYAELLAALALDVGTGQAGGRWWWPGLLRGVAPAQACGPAWLAAPEYAPGALAHLAAQGGAARFVRTLSPAETGLLVRRILERFALPALQTALAPLLDGARADPVGPQRSRAAGAPVRPHAAEAPPAVGRLPAATVAAPWQRWVPESLAPGLAPGGQVLLGIGLMLQRAPAPMRGPAFVQGVAAWAHAVSTSAATPAAPTGDRQAAQPELPPPGSAPPGGPAAPPPGTPAVPATPVPPRRAGDGDRRPVRFSAAVPVDEMEPVAAARERAVSPAVLPLARPEDDAPPPRPLAEAATESMPAAPTAPASLADGEALPQPVGEEAPAGPPSLSRPAALFIPVPAGLSTTIETRLGGVFYLLNVALFLNLYGDFTMPARPGIALSPWDFLALLGKQLAGGGRRTDPLWNLLATLAGRETAAAPGADFAPPAAWRVPVAWLLPFAPGRIWHWVAQEGRLRVSHPAHFTILDVPLAGGDPRRQVRRETAAYAAATTVRLRHGAGPPRPVAPAGERWLAHLSGYVRARLRRALGPARPAGPGRLLCRHTARVVVTSTHLDVILRLAELPIAIRLAGLDRNPGWVPAAGRYITFHFE